ncbi:sperm acrosome membrane-associated protein 4-like [Stegastes partitus]|uniref:Sperm acrosome membrane-associated protein 4-like n=1 Tax=Stegastes partitus TaxID=144197 RepID=A0A9Y4N787_9TELE|nr:PREDICTED: sperm acrosome membrane-associated protein 4-like [Stegastes partitus]
MNKLLWSCAALLTLFVAVNSLMCNTCDVSILGYCVATKPVNCSAEQNECYSGVAKFSADLLDIHARGCIAPSACKNETASILSVTYTITRTCCSTNLCNGAASSQLPLPAALCAALVAVWSQFYN